MIVHGIHIAYIPAIIAGCFVFFSGSSWRFFPSSYWGSHIGAVPGLWSQFLHVPGGHRNFCAAPGHLAKLQQVIWIYHYIYICTQVCIHCIYIYNVCLDIGFWMISRDIDDVYSGHICSSLGKKNPPSLCPEVQTPSDKLWKLSPTQAPRDLATGLLPYGSGSKFESLDWRIREKITGTHHIWW